MHVNAPLDAWLAVCLAGFAVSLRSAGVLRKPSIWTMTGWLATAAYFAIAAYDAVLSQRAPLHADYVAVGILIVAFVVAGIRDEPQADPWYWPTHAAIDRNRPAKR
jgi:hypothetical protein